MNGIGSIYPKNTSNTTVDRLIDAAVNGKSTTDAAVDYKGCGTQIVACFRDCAGEDHYAQDVDKLALEESLSKACANMTIVLIGFRKELVSKEFALRDKNDVLRYYRLVRQQQSEGSCSYLSIRSTYYFC